MASKTLIFDFDGTIVDSLSVVIETYNEIAEARGFRQLDRRSYSHLRLAGLSGVFKWAGIRKYQAPGLLKVGRQIFLKKQGKVSMFPGSIATLKKLDENGHKLYILSSNSNESTNAILRKNGIGGLMTILPASSLGGKSRVIRKLLRNQNLQAENVWMIGDEVRDIEAAHKAGVNSCGVTWGFQPKEALQNARPTVLVESFEEFLATLN